jgi:membrane protein
MLRIPIKELAPIVRLTVWNWQQDRAPRMGAALAYYMALSLAPTVVIILAVTGVAFGAKAAQGRLVGQIQNLVGKEGAVVIQSMIEGAHESSKSGIFATVFGLVTLFFGATAVVSELRDALNTIWRVPEDPLSSATRSAFNLVKERLLSFVIVLAAGVFLLLSLIVTTWVAAAGAYLSWLITPPLRTIQAVEWAISFLLVTGLFAFVFKVLPAVRLEWSDVASGALLTSLLFSGGKLLLGLYLGKAGFGDIYGPAGSLVVVLVWVYYSAQVVYFGAEFTRAYTLRCGSMLAGESRPRP